MTNPTLITTPFAENGDKNTIPESVGAAPQNATMQAGFPPITQQKISEGGIPPERNDFNGMFNLVTQHLVHLNKGLPYEFNQDFANKIGGYPLNARLMLSNGDIVQSIIANNINNPNNNMTGWVKVNSAEYIEFSDGSNVQELFDALGRKDYAVITPEMFGAKANDPGFDNTTALNNAFSTGINVYSTPDKTYFVSGILNTKGQKLIGGWKIQTSRKDDHQKDIANYPLTTDNQGFDNSGNIRIIYVSGAYELCEMLAIKQLGFNSIHHYGAFHHLPSDFDGTLEKLANNCKTAGLKISFGTEQHPLAISDLQEFVRQCDLFDATFAYSVYDEPAARGFTVAQQDARIQLLRGYTKKYLTMVDYISTLTPFTQLFSTKYDIAYVNSYALQDNTLDQNLAKMRFDFGGVKAMTGISRLIPVVSSYLDNGNLYTDDINAVIASSSIFGTVGNGEFGAFIWDGYSDPNILVNTRNNQDLRNLVKGLCSQIRRKSVTTNCYLFGKGAGQTDWGISSIIDNLTVSDNSSDDSRFNVNAYPVVLSSGSNESDRVTTIPNAALSGIGFKGFNSYLCTKIQALENTNIHLEYVDFLGVGNATIRLCTTNDNGYHKTTRYEQSVNTNIVIKQNIKTTAPNDNLLFELETVSANSYYRQFLRGLIICTNW